MKISDCKHRFEFNISGFMGIEGRDFTSWSKILWVQITQLSNKIMNDSKMTASRLVMTTQVRNLLLISITQLYPHFDLEEGKVGRWEIIVNDNCEDNTIFVTTNEDGEKYMFILVESKNKYGYKEASLVQKTEFTKEEVEEYEKKTRGCIILKNNIFNE